MSKSVLSAKVLLEKDGMIKSTYVGYCWSYVILPPFIVPIFRGRYKDAIVIFIAYSIAVYALSFVGAAILGFLLSLYYNDYATREMIKEGYYPVDENSADLLKEAGIDINESNR